MASRHSTLYDFLNSNYNQATAVEMEGFGFLQACYTNNVPGLVVRGISDLLSGKKKVDAGGSQEIAAKNATAFSLQILSRLANNEGLPRKVIAVPANKGCLGIAINVPKLPANFLHRESDFQTVKDELLSEEKKP